MEDEPRKAAMNAHRPSFRSQAPSRGIEQGDHVFPCTLERFHLGGFIHHAIVSCGDRRDREVRGWRWVLQAPLCMACGVAWD